MDINGFRPKPILNYQMNQPSGNRGFEKEQILKLPNENPVRFDPPVINSNPNSQTMPALNYGRMNMNRPMMGEMSNMGNQGSYNPGMDWIRQMIQRMRF